MSSIRSSRLEHVEDNNGERQHHLTNGVSHLRAHNVANPSNFLQNKIISTTIFFFAAIIILEVIVVEHIWLQSGKAGMVFFPSGFPLHLTRTLKSFENDLKSTKVHVNTMFRAPLATNDPFISDENAQLQSKIKPLSQILEEAGSKFSDDQKFPSVEEVEQLYGDKPTIMGLETCQKFRETVPQTEAYVAPAGMFNTGTNLINSLLRNCYLPEKLKKDGVSRGMRMQVPWGKHNPVAFRGNHVAVHESARGVNHTAVLAIVAIKDPYTWMTSMCRHKYFTSWDRSSDHCPGLVPSTTEEKKNHPNDPSLRVRMKYIKSNITYYDSLVELWNTWYNDWVYVDFPRLIVRYEDLLFHAEYLTKQVCKCAGGVMNKRAFKQIAGAAKTLPIHKGSSGLLESLLRYSNSTVRKEQYWKDDIEYARKHLNSEIMNFFHYEHITSDS